MDAARDTHIVDYHCSFAVVSINPANCTPDIYNSPTRSYPLQNRRPNSMYDVAFSHQTYTEIFACDAPNAIPNQPARTDPNR